LFGAPLAAAELSGQVTGYGDDAPLDGVQVLVMDRLGQAAVAHTASDGSYTVSGIDPGMQRVRAVPPNGLNRIGAWYSDQYFFCGADSLVLSAQEEVDGIDFALPEGGFIVGEVRSLGEPVSDATVIAQGLDFFNSSLRRTAHTDADGRFRIQGLDSIVLGGEPQAGNYRLSVQRAGEAPWFYPGTFAAESAWPVPALRGTEAEASFDLPMPSQVHGRVLGPGGEPVPGADVSLHFAGGLQVQQSNEEGVFEFDDVFAGEVVLGAVAPGMAMRWYPVADVREEAEFVDLTAGGAEEIEVRLAGEARLVVDGVGSLEVGGRVVVVDVLSGTQLSAVSVNADAVEDSRVRLSSLPARSVRVRLEPPQESALVPVQSAELELQEGIEHELTLVAASGAQLLGAVRRRGGAPLRGARVEVFEAGAAGELIASGRADGEGRVDLRGVRAGEVLVRFSLPTFCAGDPTSVALWWPAARSRATASVLTLEAGELRELGEILLPADGDADGMDDLWEFAWGLDVLRDDSSEDPDVDGLSNLDEYLQESDPLDGGSSGAGCHQAGLGRGVSSLVPLLLLFGICRIRGRKMGGRPPCSENSRPAERWSQDRLLACRATRYYWSQQP